MKNVGKIFPLKKNLFEFDQEFVIKSACMCECMCTHSLCSCVNFSLCLDSFAHALYILILSTPRFILMWNDAEMTFNAHRYPSSSDLLH